GQHRSTMEAAIRAQKMRPDLAAVHSKAVETAQELYATEKAARETA
ncbi:LLM class flavin-dependent oxidoreductase, partial [Geobacillus sp. BMUD]|nr:LLM class flavin-dependent oxidoreductase [Geobacillus sp. BMUD]